MAAGDLTTLAKVKEWLGTTVAAQDALIGRVITAVSARIVQETQQPIVKTTWALRFNGNGRQRLILPYQPVVSVASVSIDGYVIPAAVNQRNGWFFDGNSVYFDGYAMTRGVRNVAVTFDAGYEAVPLDIEQACIELCALAIKKDRADPGVTSKSLAGESISLIATEMPAHVADIINSYRRVIPLD